MKFIVAGRQQGKTSRLFKEMSREPRMHMLCASERRADQAWHQSNEQGYTFARWRFHGPDEAIGWRTSRAHPSIRINVIWVIDQVDDFLSGLLMAEVRYATANSAVEQLMGPQPIPPAADLVSWESDARTVQETDEPTWG